MLTLSGGGYLGLFTATVLTELENSIQRPIAQSFNLLSGTSIGGIIALGLAAGKSASDIKAAFEANGAEIFGNRPRPHQGSDVTGIFHVQRYPRSILHWH